MAEPALDALLQRLRHVQPGRQAQHGDGRLARLRHVQQIVQQRLTRVRGEEVEFVEDEEDGFGGFVGGRRGQGAELAWVGEERDEGGERVGVVARLEVTLVAWR